MNNNLLDVSSQWQRVSSNGTPAVSTEGTGAHLQYDGKRVEEEELHGEDGGAALAAQVQDGCEEQVAGQRDAEQHARRPRVQTYCRVQVDNNSNKGNLQE